VKACPLPLVDSIMNSEDHNARQDGAASVVDEAEREVSGVRQFVGTLGSILKEWWLWILISPLLLVVLQYQTVTPVGSRIMVEFMLLIIVPMMFAMLGVLVLPFLVVFGKRKSLRLAQLVVTAVFLVLSFMGALEGRRLRMEGFDKLAVRSEPLVAAIRNYDAEHGVPPPALAALVPKYIPEVPGTGMMAYPEYRYHVGEESLEYYEGNPWALVVETPSGGINWDQFMYFPRQNYPKNGYGGILVRYRDWAYVHE
jgi:hypothetical protein